MSDNPSTNDQRQLSVDTGDTTAPAVAAAREAADLDFAAALDTLREGIDGYGDRISASAAVPRVVDDFTVPADVLYHPRIDQAIWHYEHDRDTIRREIELTIERENGSVTVTDVAAAFRVAAARLDTLIPVE